VDIRDCVIQVGAQPFGDDWSLIYDRGDELSGDNTDRDVEPSDDNTDHNAQIVTTPQKRPQLINSQPATKGRLIRPQDGGNALRSLVGVYNCDFEEQSPVKRRKIQ
jgi:hypothetical protein